MVDRAAGCGWRVQTWIDEKSNCVYNFDVWLKDLARVARHWCANGPRIEFCACETSASNESHASEVKQIGERSNGSCVHPRLRSWHISKWRTNVLWIVTVFFFTQVFFPLLFISTRTACMRVCCAIPSRSKLNRQQMRAFIAASNLAFTQEFCARCDNLRWCSEPPQKNHIFSFWERTANMATNWRTTDCYLNKWKLRDTESR